MSGSLLPRKRLRTFRARCEGLETRELLSGMPVIDHGHALKNAVLVGSMHAHNEMRLGPVITQVSAMPNIATSTVPSNGDVNPYGVAFVPKGFPKHGSLQTGDILVSNFNNSQNLQGTGSTIVRIRNGQQSVFYQAPAQIGLSTALSILKSGFVIVGSVPATYNNGQVASVGNGGLIVLNKSGQVVGTITNSSLLQGPWDMTAVDHGNSATLFVSNVLSGTVTRINLAINRHGLSVKSETQIASGYTHRPDPVGFEVGPTGLAYNPKNGVLYVASTGDNAIYAIPGAARVHGDHGTGQVIYQDMNHLRGPLGLALLPNGDLITANSDLINGNVNQASELVEFTPQGQFVGQLSINPMQGGAFGLAANVQGKTLTLANVNDVTNQLEQRFLTL